MVDASSQANEAMSASDWKAAYRKGTPHWADDLSPSLFAQEFVGEMRKAKAKTVLEVGSGNGRDSIFFARAGFNATAVDISPEAVDMAAKNAQDADVTISARVANAETLPFDDNAFDAFFSLSVMHSTKLDKSLPEVARVLKDGGLAFIYLYGNTVTAKGKTTDVIKLDDYINLLHEHGFILLDFYAEQEDEFDDAGEKHRLFVTLLQNG